MEVLAEPSRPVTKETPVIDLKPHLLPTQPNLLIARNSPFIHRELSWLQFNDRVMAEARLSENGLLDRVKFLAISASNLDEFFMVRFSSLTRSIERAKKDRRLHSRLSLIRRNLLEAVQKFVKKQDDTLNSLSVELAKAGIHLVSHSKSEEEIAIGKEVFSTKIHPSLTPPVPFEHALLPTLENLQIALFEEGGSWLPIPKSIPGVYLAPAGEKLFVFFLDDLLLTHSTQAFAFKNKLALIRVTCDADVAIDLEEEDSESIPDVVRTSLKKRDKGRPIRIQASGNLQSKLFQLAKHRSKLDSSQFFARPASLFLHQLWTLYSDAPEAFHKHRGKTAAGFIPGGLGKVDQIFDKIRERDYLLHHPYDSFDAFVKFIEAASKDPLVEQIEQTVYRMDALSPVLEHLKAAAKGKKVRVIIELRARFDELNNLLLAEELRKAGVEVAFGFGKLKLHAKIALVSRRESGELRYYTHLSTGNYNAKTARQYTDLAVLSSKQEFGADARNFFDNVFAGKIPTGFKTLISAPSGLHKKILSSIRAEVEAAKAGRRARIVAKMNALVDEALIQDLYRASQAGVQVDLIVRGACSLIPGVPGLSEYIRVVSIVDKLLEHSRIYYFGDSKTIYLSSADWMPRNFFSRLELAFPVLDTRIYDFIEEVVIPAYLLDTLKAQELTPQGTWKKRTTASIKPEDRFAKSPIRSRKSINAQSLFAEIAANGYRGTVLATGMTSS